MTEPSIALETEMSTRENREAAMVEGRNARVLNAAFSLAEQVGWQNITREGVAKIAGVSEGTVSNAFGGMTELKDAVMRHAVTLEHRSIVKQGIAAGSLIALRAPQRLQANALLA